MPDWTVLDLPQIDEAARDAARSVSNRYRNRAVAALAEYDDLYQEARILLATRFPDAQTLDPKLLKFRLAQDLTDLVKWRAARAQNVDSLRDYHGGKSELPRAARARGPMIREFPAEGVSGDGKAGRGILRAVPL